MSDDNIVIRLLQLFAPAGGQRVKMTKHEEHEEPDYLESGDVLKGLGCELVVAGEREPGMEDTCLGSSHFAYLISYNN